MKTEARELDEKFDAGEDITRYLEVMKARRPGHEQRRANVDFPVWMIESLDREATRLGVPRQVLIEVLIARHLEEAFKEAHRPHGSTGNIITPVPGTFDDE